MAFPNRRRFMELAGLNYTVQYPDVGVFTEDGGHTWWASAELVEPNVPLGKGEMILFNVDSVWGNVPIITVAYEEPFPRFMVGTVPLPVLEHWSHQ